MIFMTQVLPSSAYPLWRELRTMVDMLPSPTAILRAGGRVSHRRNPAAAPIRLNILLYPLIVLGEIRRLLPCFGDVGGRSGACVAETFTRVRLALLVAGTTLPIIFAAGIVFNHYKQDRQNATQRVFETVYSIRLVLDAEMQRDYRRAAGIVADKHPAPPGFRGIPPHLPGLPRPVWRRRGRAGGGPRPDVRCSTRSRPIRQTCRPATTCPWSTRSSRKEAGLFQSVLRVGQETADRDGRSAGHSGRRGALRHLLQSADRNIPGHDRAAAGRARTGRSRSSTAKAPISRACRTRKETLGKRASPSLYAQMFHNPEATVPDGIARGRAADYELCPLLAHRLDGCRRRRRELAGRAALAQPRDNKRDGRRPADGRPRLAVRMATQMPAARCSQSPDRGTQPPRQEHARGPAVDRHPDVPQRERAERDKFEEGSARWRRRNLLSQEKWQGAELRDVIARVLQPYLLNTPERMRMFGPQVPLSPRLAVVLAMIVHEIATMPPNTARCRTTPEPSRWTGRSSKKATGASCG